MKPYTLKKEYMLDDCYQFIKYDKEKDVYILRKDMEHWFTEWEYEYLETDRQLMFYINTVIKDGEVEIISAENVEWCPVELEGYFIY